MRNKGTLAPDIHRLLSIFQPSDIFQNPNTKLYLRLLASEVSLLTERNCFVSQNWFFTVFCFQIENQIVRFTPTILRLVSRLVGVDPLLTMLNLSSDFFGMAFWMTIFRQISPPLSWVIKASQHFDLSKFGVRHFVSRHV